MRVPVLCCFGLSFVTATASAGGLRGGVVRQDFKALWAAPAEVERAWGLNAEWGFDPLGRFLGGALAPFAGGTWTPSASGIGRPI